MKNLSRTLLLATCLAFTTLACENKNTTNTDTNTTDSNDHAVEADTKETGDNIKDQAEAAHDSAMQDTATAK